MSQKFVEEFFREWRQPSSLSVGSELDNGDRITGPIHNGMVIVQYADEEPS